MTSTNKSHFGDYIRYKLSRHRGLFTIAIVFNMLCFPQMYLVQLSNDYSSAFVGGSTFIGLISAIISAAIVVITPTLVFSANNQRHAVDMYLSLPLSAKERFWGDFAVSGIISVAPIIAQFYLGYFIYCLGAVSAHNMFAELMFIAITVYAVIAVFVTGVLMANICGRRADSIIFTILTALLPIIFCAEFNGIISTHIIGAGIDSKLNPVFFAPVCGQFLYANDVVSNFHSITDTSAMLSCFAPAYSLPQAIYIALCIVAGYFSGTKRPAEKTGKPFVYNIVYHVIACFMLSILIMLTLLIAENVSYAVGIMSQFIVTGILIMGFIITAILYFFTELMNKRGFKKMWQGALRYLCVVAASVGVYALLANYGYSLSFDIPSVDKDNISSVSITISGVGSNPECALDFYDTDSLRIFTEEIHNPMIKDNIRQSVNYRDDQENYTTRINIYYLIKDGNVESYYYTLNYSDYEKFIPNIKKLIASGKWQENILKDYEKSKDKLKVTLLSGDDFKLKAISGDKAWEFMQLYLEEVKTCSLDATPYAVFNLGYIDEITYNTEYMTVYDSFTKCKEFISKNAEFDISNDIYIIADDINYAISFDIPPFEKPEQINKLLSCFEISDPLTRSEYFGYGKLIEMPDGNKAPLVMETEQGICNFIDIRDDKAAELIELLSQIPDDYAGREEGGKEYYD